jgi:hypothetical protein
MLTTITKKGITRGAFAGRKWQNTEKKKERESERSGWVNLSAWLD